MKDRPQHYGDVQELDFSPLPWYLHERWEREANKVCNDYDIQGTFHYGGVQAENSSASLDARRRFDD